MTRIRRTDICFCDLCGKRIFTTEGRLTLMKKTNDQYHPYKTEKSWGLCKKCCSKVLAMECVGERVKEEIETKLAQIQIEKYPLNLLK